MAVVSITVLVPDEHGVAAFADVDGVRAVRYEPGELPEEAADAEVLVPGFLSADKVRLVGSLPKLRLVQLLTAGAEAWVGQLPGHVMLSTCSGAHGGSTAEWVVAALLTVFRDMREFEDDRRSQTWAMHQTETLQGKKVLVIGAGDLGKQLKRRLDAFDAEVTMVANSARDGIRAISELDDLLPHHDVVALMVPMTPATRHLVDAAFLAKMPDNAVVVNAARGPVVDTEALLVELQSRRLRAALDVTDPEPLPEGHPLWTAPNLLLTPHVAGSCTGVHARAYRVVVEQVRQFARGEEPSNLVRGDY
ncbi:2-hydroxyacid dehydrogenase [Actinokineospora globicatena]|uniref:2-hydroxyacid dehydrogenase n=1 Tax=Actinokineospora globicatena TaxID=103729 RepID=UPI0020A59955|nr:2-hydroxyacid dehydrogenase [Actinokineospora globicatena]MCP2305495.1 Phosphoglycerate dehydrogenase [Actinokineospora globicatena]GLW81363.1 phosphoglycerate dehydrogenase [Actinokineospora globicatena]GLW87939.1 phosphoglycerate dehydrogenase [Actinokineospora globicatena]